MIRIPFSPDSETSRAGATPARRDQLARLGGRKKESLEMRMGMLEAKLEVHARDLKARVTERVERIESRIHRAMSSITGSAEEESVGNVIEFVSEETSLHHLPAASALSALNELNATLKQTREHLDALILSVDQMRNSVPENQKKESA
ncbi:MAG: hypothetical protein P1U68_07375 [Verrucomicrobiales bacterium]|nr:hypothetical protein [Verrucomicrobiales bacterium]